MTSSVAALKQMKRRGYPIEPGEYIRFVITDGQSKESEKKVKVADFIQGDEKPDVNEYLKLLCRAGETLFLPFGYTESKLLEMCRSSSPSSEVVAKADRRIRSVQRRGGVGYILTRR
jgi:DNA polymerase elongation subunit (family B)